VTGRDHGRAAYNEVKTHHSIVARGHKTAAVSGRRPVVAEHLRSRNMMPRLPGGLVAESVRDFSESEAVFLPEVFSVHARGGAGFLCRPGLLVAGLAPVRRPVMRVSRTASAWARAVAGSGEPAMYRAAPYRPPRAT
jgi:hypothetical protein